MAALDPFYLQIDKYSAFSSEFAVSELQCNKRSEWLGLHSPLLPEHYLEPDRLLRKSKGHNLEGTMIFNIYFFVYLTVSLLLVRVQSRAYYSVQRFCLFIGF